MRLSPSRLLDIDVLAYLVLFTAVFLHHPLADYDYFWHLKTGDVLVNERALPTGDIFSFTMQGEHWVLHEWGFQVALYLIHAAFGDGGVKFISSTLLFVALAISFSPARRLNLRPLETLVLLLLFIVPLVPYTQPRPQIITYVFFAYFLKCLLDYKNHKDDKSLRLLPLLMIIWVNFHGGYIIGIALIGLFAMSETVQSIYRRTAIPKAYWFALGLTLITSTLNPYGFKHLFYPFEVFSLVAVSRIQEWAPLNLTSSQATLFMALACFLALLYTTRRRLPDITETLIPVVFIIAALSSRRHLPLAMLTLIPFCLYAYADRVHAMVNGHLHRYMSTSPNSIPIAWRIVFAFSFSAFTISALVYSYSGVQTTHRQTIESALPVKLVDYIQENNIRGRVFNTYRYGGYLIYRLYPEQEVFIDGRADLYGDKIFLDYLTIYHAQDGWEKLFHNYKIDYVICEKGAPIRKALLESGDFVEEMTDSMNALLTRKIPLNQADI